MTKYKSDEVFLVSQELSSEENTCTQQNGSDILMEKLHNGEHNLYTSTSTVNGVTKLTGISFVKHVANMEELRNAVSRKAVRGPEQYS
jgi:hypothetical protein